MCIFIPKRFVVLGLTCLGMLAVHAMRVTLSVTIIMALDNTLAKEVSPSDAIASLPDIRWNSTELSYLRSIFYLGLLLTQIPAGYLATRLPAHLLFGGFIFISCAFNLLLPLCLLCRSYVLTCAVKLVQGLSEGFLFPSAYAILWHWSPSNERSRLGALVLTGVYAGALIGQPLSVYITITCGWMNAYFILGGVGLLWVVLWIFFAYDRPENHPTLSTHELALLADDSLHQLSANETIPWRGILTSPAVLVLCFCNSVFFLIYTNAPGYVSAFGFRINHTSWHVSLPHIALAMTTLTSGFIADCLIRRMSHGTTKVRKMFTFIGFGFAAVCLLVLVFISASEKALTFLTLGVAFAGLTISGWQISPLDLAPRYACVIIGLSNSVGTLVSIFSPIVVAYLTSQETISEWQKIMAVFSSFAAMAAVLYAVFGSGELQPWGAPKKDIPHGAVIKFKTLPKPPKLLNPSSYVLIPTQLRYKEWSFFENTVQKDPPASFYD